MFIGVDVGTSVTKAAAFSPDTGEILAVARVPTRLYTYQDGRVEQDLEEVLASVVEVVRAVRATAGADPRLIGVTGQGDGCWLVDEAGHAVRPAISWMDGRAGPLLRRWLKEGLVEKAFRRTGNVMFPGSAGPILAYLDRHEPHVLDAAATAGYCKDVVLQRLTGLRVTEVSDASLPFLDPLTRDYADDVIAVCGLAHRRGLLAPVRDPAAVGELSAEAAARLGVPAGTPVVAAPFDLPSCALGAGVTRPGDGLLIIGTTLACQVVVDAVATDGEVAGMTLGLWEPRRWLRAMPAMVGTASLDWVLGMLGLRHDQLSDLLSASPPGARGVSVLPYFAPSGERAPFIEPDARAEITGVSLHTDKADLVRAVCEAIAYAARHCFEAAGLRGELSVCGGGAKSGPWLRLFADVLGRPLRVARGPEVGTWGAVLAAAGRLGVPVDAAAWTEPETVIEPRSEHVARYEEGYADYLARVETARARWSRRRTR